MGKTNTVTKDKAHYRVMAVLSFFMTFFSFLMICAAVVQFTVLNPQFFTSVVKSSGYLQSCQEILEETFASYGAASNFDAEVFAPFASEEKILQAVQQNIDYLYGKGDAPNLQQYQDDLVEALLQNVEDRGIGLTASIETGVQTLAESCRAELQQYTSIPFLEFAIRGIEMAQKPVMAVLAVLLVIMALLLVFMWMISRKLERFLPFLIDSCFALTILGVLLPILGLSQKVFERINISPESTRILIIGYGNGIMTSFFPAAIVTGVIGVALVVLLQVRAKKAQQ